jgi:hypothetical protein
MALFSNLFNRKSNQAEQTGDGLIVENFLKGLTERLSQGDQLELSYATGASSGQLAALKKRFLQCPHSLLQLLSRINGTYWQEYGPHTITVLILGSDVFEYPYYLKSVEQILEENNEQLSIHDLYDGDIDDELVGAGINPNLKISRWVCFSDCMNNGGTSMLYIDFNPARGGTVGQVVRYLHDPDSYEVIAKSFDGYLQMLIDGGYAYISPED